MKTNEQLEQIVEELERKVNAALEKTNQLQRSSEKALDTAMHAYTLDEYGYLWAYDAETKAYRKTKMRVATPEIIAEAVKAIHIAAGAVTGDKIEAGAVVPGKIADDAVQTRNIKNGAIFWEKLDAVLQNLVLTGGGQHGVPLSPEFGDSDLIGVTQRTLTGAHQQHLDTEEGLQSQINAIVADKAQVALSADPTVVFVGTESSIILAATTNPEASSIVIKKGDTVLATGSGNSLTTANAITPEVAGNIQYHADFVIAGLSRSTGKNIQAVHPIRIGSGTAYVDGTPLTTPKTSPAGTYNIAVANDGDYVYINVPATMTIHGATMSGFAFPLEAPVTVEIDRVAYKSYRSSNTYVAGTLTIVIL